MPTLAELQARLSLHLEAEARILLRQSYQFPDGRQVSYTQLPAVQSMIRSLQQQIATHPENNASGGRLSHSSAIFGGRR